MKAFFLAALVLLTACRLQAPVAPLAETTPVLHPFLTATPSLTATPALQTAKPPPQTATPFTYTVQSGDTLSGIAEKFHIRLEALQAANPGISPSNMPVGTVLNIPGDAGLSAVPPTPTPVDLPIRQTICYPTTEGGLWCFVLVHNDTPDPIENISAQITLYNSGGQILGTQTAFSLLNIVPPGESLPLLAFFPPNLPADVMPRTQLLTATRLMSDDARYLPVSLENMQTSIDWSGQTAQVRGKVFLREDAASPAGQVWIAAVAYTADGRVAGVRRWESLSTIDAGSRLDFAFVVFSAGPPIEHVTLLVEAQAKK
jgi:LysM repeat protein